MRQTLIHGWKKQALDGMAGVFSAKADAPALGATAEIEKLHAKIGEFGCGTGFFAQGLRSMSAGRRRELVEPEHPGLSILRQCALLSISRAHDYGPVRGESAENLGLMRVIDAQFLETPWYGSRRRWRAIFVSRAMTSIESAFGG